MKKAIFILAAGLATGSAALMQHRDAHAPEPDIRLVAHQVKPAEVPTTTQTTTATTTTATQTTTEPIDATPLYDIPLSEELQEYTYSLCEQYDIVEHYEVVLGMMRTESNFNADVVSTTGDYGIMQINECNHTWLKNELGIVDIMDVRENIECGIYMVSDLFHNYSTVDQALMAYNMGPAGAASLWREGIYSSSYSIKVLGSAELIKSSKK